MIQISHYIAKPLTIAFALCLFIMLPSATYAQSADAVKAELEEKLAEAMRLLEEDKASHDETAERKRMIDEKLAEQKQREAELRDEVTALCEEQEKVSAGSMASCMAKIDN